MPGELSKRIGEEGEKLAREFLKKINWLVAEENIDVSCFKSEEHQRSGSSPSHGVDFIVAYDCPLIHTVRRNVLISMKNSAKEETSNQSAAVKHDLTELSRAIACYGRSREKQQINEDSSRVKTSLSGLLIKINKDKDGAESFLPQADEDKRLNLEDGTELFFMENKRFDFVDLAIDHLLKSHSNHSWTYFYPPTTVNYAADVAEIEGELIPLQHLLGGPLTFRLNPKKNDENPKKFVIVSSESFSSSDLSRLIGLANGCSHGWASQISIVFPELSPEDRKEAERIARGVKSQTFATSITIESFENRSRLK